MLSIVVPIHNEERAILPIYDGLTATLQKLQRTYEVIFVDDASTDGGFELLANLVETDDHLKVVRLRRNFGPATALAAGFDEARGSTLVSLEGGFQHHPDTISLLLKKIDEGFDIASAWGQDGDGSNNRRIAGHLGSWLLQRVAGVRMHDFGATWKAYRAEILKDVNLYSELHRFIPVLADFYGARVAEVPVAALANAKRPHAGETWRAFFDVLTSRLLLRYLARPMHSVGVWGVAGLALGSVLLAALGIAKLWLGMDISAQQTPLFFVGAMFWLTGLMLLSVGLIGEVLMRTYFESQGRRIYAVREVRARRDRVVDGAR